LQEAYSQGVVLATCPGCNNIHLIADRLGWFGESEFDVLQMAREKGEVVRQLNLSSGPSTGLTAEQSSRLATMVSGVFELTSADLKVLSSPNRSANVSTDRAE
jgi:DNL zinc finger